MNSTAHQDPFPCVRFKEKYPGLGGVFFQMISNSPSLHRSQCVYAGPDCTFDGMVSFVNKSSSISNYQWVAAGILFVLEDRILPGVIPSTAILTDHLHVIGPPVQSQESFGDALSLILKPFSREAWIVFLSVLFLFGAVRLLMIYMFGNTIGLLGFLRTFCLFNFRRDVRERATHEDDWWRILKYVQKLIAFESVRNPTLENYSASEFAVYKDTTEEHFFQKMVQTKTLHKRFNNLDAVYKALETNPKLKYTVSYAIDNRYKFTTLGEVTEFVDQAIGSDEVTARCKPGSNQIGWYMLLLLVALPIIYLIAICVVIGIANFAANPVIANCVSNPSNSDPEICATDSLLCDASTVSMATVNSNDTYAKDNIPQNTGLTETRRRSTS